MVEEMYDQTNLTMQLAVPKAPSKPKADFSAADLSRIIEMAWEDRTPFEAINQLYGLDHSALVQLMRRQLSLRSFKVWRARVAGRQTKHLQLRHKDVNRGYCPTQYKR